MIISKNFRDALLDILALPNTIIFNFKYFPLKQAIKLPVYVSHRVWLMQLDGKVEIESTTVRRKMITIGFGRIGIFDRHNSRSIWQVAGHVVFKGAANIGHGSKLSVGGKLVLGSGFRVSAESTIVASSRVEIGRNALFSWDIFLADTDFHDINDAHGKVLNPRSPVILGDNVWIGCRTMILKGSNLSSGTIVAAGTTITSSGCFEENSIVGGNPARVIKQDVTWWK